MASGEMENRNSSARQAKTKRRRRSFTSSLQQSEINRGKILLQDLLYKNKKSTFGNHWPKRYFVLYEKSICFYKASKDVQESSGKELFLGLNCRVDDIGRFFVNNKYMYVFKLQIPHSKPFIIGSRDPEKTAIWIQSIQSCIAEAMNDSMIDESKEAAIQRISSLGNVSMSDDDDDNEMEHLNLSNTFDACPLSLERSKIGIASDATMSSVNNESTYSMERETDEFDDDSLPTNNEMNNESDNEQDVDLVQETDTFMEADINMKNEGMDRPKFHGRSMSHAPPVELNEMLEAMKAMKTATSDIGVAADGAWKLLSLSNGLRFFEEVNETKQFSSMGKCQTLPCMSSIGTVDARSDAIFRLIMDLGPIRNEWDTAFDSASVIETGDGHTDVIHYKMKNLPLFPCTLSLPSRDLCVRRYWQRSHDGSYTILFQSMEHEDCPRQQGCVRASLAHGGFIIAPCGGFSDLPRASSGSFAASQSTRGKSIVMHVLQLDPCGWIPHCFGFPQSLHFALLGRVAGIREFFAQMQDQAVRALTGLGDLEWQPRKNLKEFEPILESPNHNVISKSSSLSSISSLSLRSKVIPVASPSESNEFGTSTSASDSSLIQSKSSTVLKQESYPDNTYHSSFSLRFRGVREKAKGSMDESWSFASEYGSLPKGKKKKGRGEGDGELNSWLEVKENIFPVRAKSYLVDKVKMPAGPSMMKLVAVDWLKSENRIDHVVDIRETVIQATRKRISSGEMIGIHKPFFFVVNMQVPAALQYSMVFYWVMNESVAKDSMLFKFIHGDDLFRNTRFKLIPRIQKGAWMVKRTVGTTPLIIPGALKVNYFSGHDYFECDVDIGSSTVANGIVRFVLGYVKTLIIDLAYLIQSNSEEELPERLLGTVRLCHLDPDAALDLDKK